MNKPIIEIASQSGVDTFQSEIDRLLSVLGHPEALVTDESQVADFMIFLGVKDPEIDQHNEEILEGLADLMNREVDPGEFLWVLARELYQSSSPLTIN